MTQKITRWIQPTQDGHYTYTERAGGTVKCARKIEATNELQEALEAEEGVVEHEGGSYEVLVGFNTGVHMMPWDVALDDDMYSDLKTEVDKRWASLNIHFNNGTVEVWDVSPEPHREGRQNTRCVEIFNATIEEQGSPLIWLDTETFGEIRVRKAKPEEAQNG